MMINGACRINSIWPEYFHDNNISLHSPFRAGADHNNHQLQGSSIYKKIMTMKFEGSRSTFYSDSSNISTTTGVHQRQAVNALPTYAALPHDQAIISTSTTLNYDDIHHDQIPVTNYSSTTTSTHVAPSTNYINYGNHDTLKETSASLHSNIYADPLISFFEEYSMLKQLQGLGGFCGMESLI
ncbi:hypothetical protein AXF42_Ash013501 [Apostasia shenzhenica]|uniref:Uncharacterized protein n=1 Tax=Apostasia shenzhenica TaxID=1088818 RepID=A0A2I0A4E7_9ASPA|nr:hypothetical protein AXF42_Ash013501 [Apostasia shenzhenica]